jgi:hypothetical protein
MNMELLELRTKVMLVNNDDWKFKTLKNEMA